MLTVDTLAQEIRRVDGNHSLGAGALAEALMPFLAALAVQTQQGVEVKKLEWVKHPSAELWRAYTTLGVYQVHAFKIPGWTFDKHDGGGTSASADDIEAAKAAAYADHKERVLALVDVPAVESEPVAWKQIEGYEGLYEVSSGGDVRSMATGKILAKNLAGYGYVKADLWKDGERHQTTVHRLVADAFIPRTGDEINHINGVKTDNRRENLEWCSRSENVIHTYYTLCKGIHPIEAFNPDTNVTRLYRSVCEAARDGFGSAQIYRALRKPHRRVKGFHFSTHAHPPRSSLIQSDEGEITLSVKEAEKLAARLELDASWDKCGDGYYSIKRQLSALSRKTAAPGDGSAISTKGNASG
jgi:hypothetical protein